MVIRCGEMYSPCVMFRAKCFTGSAIALIFGTHYEAVWEDKFYKTERGAINFAQKQIDYDPDVYQLPAARLAPAGRE